MIRGLNSPGGFGLQNRGPQQPQQQFYDDEPYRANASQFGFKNNMERRETGNLIPISQRSLGGSSTGVTPFGSAPTQSFFGNGGAGGAAGAGIGAMMGNGGSSSSPRKMPQQPHQMLFGGIPQKIPPIQEIQEIQGATEELDLKTFLQLQGYGSGNRLRAQNPPDLLNLLSDMSNDDEMAPLTNRHNSPMISGNNTRRATPLRRRLMSAPTNPRWSPTAAIDERKMINYGVANSTINNGNNGKTSPPMNKIMKRNSFVNTPYRNAQPVRKYAEKQRSSPPSDGSDKIRRYGESPTSGSYPNEYDDFIIDELIGLEEEQRRTHNSGRPMSVGLSNDKPGQMSMARPIPGSSRGSGHSGSPITIPNALGNNFRQVVSSSAPTSSIDIEKMMGAVGNPDGEDYYRDRRKKDIHNMIERRRRYNINDRIKELGQMLPKASADDMKLNKGTILKASCDYIRILQRDRDAFAKQQQHAKAMETTAKQYADRVKELEEVLTRQGVQVPPSHLPPLPKFIDRPIKQEIDDSSPTNQTPTGSYMSTSGFLSEVTNNTAAMQITSPQDSHRTNNFMNNSATSDSFFSVGSASPPDYRTNNWKMPQQNNFPDLMMDDINNMQTNPLMNGGDPLISAAGAHPSPHFGNSQMSPDIHWDASGFSPDPTNPQQTSSSSGGGTGGGYHQMDYS